MYVCMYVCMDGWMDGWMDVYMIMVVSNLVCSLNPRELFDEDEKIEHYNPL